MIKASDIMTNEVVTVSPETEISRAAEILLEKHVNGLPVVDRKGRLVGIICQSDLVAQQKRLPIPSVFNLLDSLIPISSTKNLEKEITRISAATVAQAMTPDPVTVGPEDTIETIATLMVEKGFHTIPVVDSGKLVGIIGKEDVLRTIMQEEKNA